VTESLRANGGTNATDVLIVGGGPVGLSLGIELARLGVPAVLVDSRDGTIKTPKMNFVNVRSMEFCRRWGLTGAVRAAGHPADFHPNVVWATSVTGHEIARLDFPPFLEEKTRFFSPAADCLISQYWFDPILLAHAHAQPSLTLRHRTRLDSFRETGGGIAARVTDLVSGRAETVTAAYIVGCDGAASTVRDSLGIGLEGLPAMQNNFHVFLNSTELIEIFESTLGQARFCNLVGPEGVWGMITSINWRGLWRFSMQPPPADESLVPELLRRAVGRDFDFELLDSSHWVSRKLVADAFRKGRAFIAGDAAHQLNPSGGFGMNTGVGDAVDLAWKLRGTLAGWGGPELLASYEIERRPIAVRNVEEATRNFRLPQKFVIGSEIDRDTAEGARQREAFTASLYDADIMRHHDTDGIALGYRYDPSPIVWPDGTEAPADAVRDYAQTARPGHRAPHAWLDGGPPPSAGIRLEGGRSTLDLFGNGFVLLDFGAAPGEAARLAREAAVRGVPFEVATIAEPDIAALYARRLVLVRPDGHVAWRADAAPADAGAVIDGVRGAGAARAKEVGQAQPVAMS
jgi:2-polyprenyl-6-methoxyphenol hydroxylase-like FAD-dependent oxidoreductase